MPPRDIQPADAYYSAGQAIAITLGNTQKQLPDVYYQLCLNPCPRGLPAGPANSDKSYVLALEGGRLIHSLPMCLTDSQAFVYDQDHAMLHCALEADVVNLLSGPLAEAKYTAAIRGETLNEKSLALSTLRFYSQGALTEQVDDYLECLSPLKIQRQHHFLKLLKASFNFINDGPMWSLIKALAEYIQAQPKAILTCEEIRFFLNSIKRADSATLPANALAVCH